MPLVSYSSSVMFFKDSEMRYRYCDLKEAYISLVKGTSTLSNTSPAGIFLNNVVAFFEVFFPLAVEH